MVTVANVNCYTLTLVLLDDGGLSYEVDLRTLGHGSTSISLPRTLAWYNQYSRTYMSFQLT